MPLITAHAALAVVWGPLLARNPGAAPALYAAAFGALALCWLRLRRPAGSTPLSGAGILLVALLLRLLALPLAPVLSSDVHRYLWDGRVVLAGENPYRLAPEDPRLEALRDDGWRRVDHREVPTVYPPLALGAFAVAAATPRPLLALKVLLAAADLAGCAALLALARRLGLELERTVWYAWNPLAVIETAGMGHVDALGVAAAVAAGLWLARGRSAGTGAWVAAGALAKLAPLAVLPHWVRRSGRPGVALAVAAGLTAAALVPVALATGGVPPGLVTYGVSWEFAGPLYEPLWRLFEAGGAEAAAKAGLDGLKEATGSHELWNRLYPFAYPRLFAKASLALLLLVVVGRSLSDRRALAGPGIVFGALLLASATVYPWYLLWVLPWAALALQPAWLLAAATAPLAYLGGPTFPWLWLAIWGPPAALLVVLPRARRWGER